MSIQQLQAYGSARYVKMNFDLSGNTISV